MSDPKVQEDTPLLSRQRQGSWENDAKTPAKKPSPLYIIFPLFALTFGFGALYAPMIQFYTVIFCYRYYQSLAGFDGGMPPLEDCAIPQVQAIVSEAQAIVMFLTYGSTLLLAGYYGSLSDRKGRRLVLKIACFGNVLLLASYILTMHYPHIFGISLLFIFPVVRGLLAGDSVMVATCQAYLSDCTTPSERTIAFGHMLSAFFLGTTLGPFVSSFVIKQTGSINHIFYAVFVINVLFELYIFFVLPESHNFAEFNLLPKKEEQTFLQRINAFSALKILFRSSTQHANKYALPIIALIQFFMTMVALPPIFLYAMLKFGWTAYEGGLFISASSLLKLIILAGLLPFLSKLFHKNKAPLEESDIVPTAVLVPDEFAVTDEGESSSSPVEIVDEQPNEKEIRHTVVFDAWMVRVGLATEIIGFILFSLATTSEGFTATLLVTSFAALSAPSVRSLTTTLVQPNEVGEVLGAMAVLEACAMIISQLTLNTIYSASVNTMPQLIFYVCAALVLIPLVASFFLKPSPLPKSNGIFLA